MMSTTTADSFAVVFGRGRTTHQATAGDLPAPSCPFSATALLPTADPAADNGNALRATCSDIENPYRATWRVVWLGTPWKLGFSAYRDATDRLRGSVFEQRMAEVGARSYERRNWTQSHLSDDNSKTLRWADIPDGIQQRILDEIAASDRRCTTRVYSR